ncbi:hypothetical protein GN244_ATG11655 [Phytophthora infestans]|uniref:Uncharacterized protein n=1 Tax=Phytophthora infestans TaxID=4787 RepID=A0A833S879_PHYIN|nr:hypothetical protein GN244_ATG11655 [Phytophthora infestans]
MCLQDAECSGIPPVLTGCPTPVPAGRQDKSAALIGGEAKILLDPADLALKPPTLIVDAAKRAF